MAVSPNPPMGEYAAFVANCLRDVLQIDLPPDFESIFVSHARRLGEKDYEDLGSLMLVECHEMKQQGHTIDALEVTRMIDRIRHRLVRRAKKEVPIAMDGRLANGASVGPAQLESALRGFVGSLQPLEMLIFEMRYLRNQSIGKIGEALGISQATVYRRISEVREAFESYVREHV